MTTEQEATPEPVSEAEAEQPKLEKAEVIPEPAIEETPETAPIPETISDIPADEVLPEPPIKTVQEQLAEKVRMCFLEGKSCKDLGKQFDIAARTLRVRVDDLTDEVFAIAKRTTDEQAPAETK